MKYLLFEDQFRDKTFWHMITPRQAIENSVTALAWFEASGGTVTIEDREDYNKYQHHICVWIEHPDEKVILEMVLKQTNS